MPPRKKFDEPMKSLGVRLPDSQLEQIRHVEAATNLGSADVIRYAIAKLFDNGYADVIDQLTGGDDAAEFAAKPPEAKLTHGGDNDAEKA